jgi:hypothetical protein
VQLILLITVLVVWKRLRSSVLGSSEGSWDLPIPRAGERDYPAAEPDREEVRFSVERGRARECDVD